LQPNRESLASAVSGATIFFVSACQFVWLLWLSAVQLVRRNITERLDHVAVTVITKKQTRQSGVSRTYLMCSDH